MRGRRRTALGVLVAAMTAAGVLAPSAAEAATTAIAWQTWGSTLEPGDSTSVCTTGGDFLEEGQSVLVQVQLGGVWTTKKQIVVGGWEQCVDVTPSELVPGPGTYYLRAQFRPAPAAAVLQATTAVTLVRLESYAYLTDRYDLFSLTTTLGRNLDVEVSPTMGQAVDLQRKVSGVWTTIARKTAGTSGESSHVAFAIPTRPGNTPYRTVVRPTTWSDQDVSPTYTGHQTDVAKHGNYLIAARKAMARFCPKTPIYVNTSIFQVDPGLAGYHVPTIDPLGDDTYRFRSRIELRSGYSGTFLKHLALHECAHAVQARSWIEGKYWGVEVPRAEKLFPGTGFEGQADCMAWLITRSTSSMHYVRSCSSLQQANAQRMWQDYGYKYQGLSYTWTDPTGTVGSTSQDDEPIKPPVPLGGDTPARR